MHQIVFDLYPFGETLFLPTANIVAVDKQGMYSHIFQKATPETLPPYEIKPTAVQVRLFRLIDLLSPKALEAKFKAPKAKAVTPLAQLLANKETQKTVETYIYRELDNFLSEIVQNALPLSFGAEKKSLVKDVLLTFSRDELVPHLFFKKNETGVEYRLTLGTETEKWRIREHHIVPLTNTSPAWLLVGYALFRVPGINGNMVKPFQKKDVLDIPSKNVREYFQKIIVKNANRTQIESEGFDMIVHDRVLGAELRLVEDFFHKKWHLSLRFRYHGREVEPSEKQKQFTWVTFPDDAPIALIQIKRNQATEGQYMEALLELGLQEINQLYSLPDAHGFEQALLWLAKNKERLKRKGFEVIAPVVQEKVIAVLEARITLESEVKNDWFDVHGILEIGQFSFPFKNLASFIKSKNPYFPLPDGTFFLIPEAWFAQYAELFKSAKDGEGDNLRLNKSLFTLLEELNVPAGTSEFPEIDIQLPDFELPKSLNATLRPYQLEGVKWMVAHHNQGFGTCLADDMGLGKTLQTIAVLLAAKEKKQQGERLSTRENKLKIEKKAKEPAQKKAVKKGAQGIQLDLFHTPADIVQGDSPLHSSGEADSPFLDIQPPLFTALVILPASLVFNWYKELEKFAPSLFVYVHTGAKRHTDARALAAHDIVLTTYHTARNDLDVLGQIEWDFIVLDESQQIKNRDSEVSKVVRSLESKQRISLSGTPIENSLADLWTQMEFINPSTLGSFNSFKEHFLLPIERYNDEAAKSTLFRRIRPFFLRRTKEEVAPDLPPLTEQVFFTEMAPEQKQVYEKTKSAVRNEILSLFDDPSKRMLAIQALTRLRQIANHPVMSDAMYEGGSGKFEDVMLQWENVRRSGQKVLIFSFFEKHLQVFRRFFEAEKIPFAWLTGETSQKDRQKQVELFQNDKSVQAFFMTTKAGGVGLNLTAANFVFILDPWWNPQVENQAVARAHRIGQQHPVVSIRFIAKETIEEKIKQLQERKAQLGIDFFSVESDMPAFDRDDLEMLLS